MTNAERQQRWRDLHRPRKRKTVTWGPDGRLFINGQLAPPPPSLSPPAVAPPLQQPVVAATSPPEHNYCPHCGAAIRKRSKAAKLAA
jgi:hypothetical protein